MRRAAGPALGRPDILFYHTILTARRSLGRISIAADDVRRGESALAVLQRRHLPTLPLPLSIEKSIRQRVTQQGIDKALYT